MPANNSGAYSDVNQKGNRDEVISVGTSAVEIKAHATDKYRGRQTVFFENLSNKIIWIGSSGVTVGAGARLYAGQKGWANIGPDNKVYAITDSGTADLFVWEFK